MIVGTILFLVSAVPLALCQAPNSARFQSRPDLNPPVLEVTRANEGVTEGYIYLTPTLVQQPGPYIFNRGGEFVFSGYGAVAQGAVGSNTVEDFRPCDFQGSTQFFCMWQGNVANGNGNGHATLMDNRFQAVKSLPPSDYHEFLVPEPYDNAIVSVYQPVQRDLTAFGVLSGRGWVVNSRFKQLRLATNETVFDWASLDHVPLSEGTVPPGRTSTGLSETFAWDYFHLNSVDTLPNGDFLVSSRHTSTVYRISGRDGSIVWRLGGRTSTFALTNFNFTFQHDARYVRGSESGSTLTLTLFDNAYNGITARDSDSSSGKVIRINTATRTAELLVQLNFPDPPTTPFLSSDGGSVQALDGGNYFVGWGSNAYVTEHSPNGNCIYVANFGSGSSAASYRAFKGPLQDILAGSQVNDDSLLPDVFAYAHNTSAPTMVYVSWNGDHYTESWSIYGLDSPSGPPTTQEYRVNKSGFETTFTIPTFHRYVAVGPNPNVRGFSNSTVATFVPGPELANECNDFGCRDA